MTQTQRYAKLIQSL